MSHGAEWYLRVLDPYFPLGKSTTPLPVFVLQHTQSLTHLGMEQSSGHSLLLTELRDAEKSRKLRDKNVIGYSLIL